jgi:hypothetical protein
VRHVRLEIDSRLPVAGQLRTSASIYRQIAHVSGIQLT